MILATLKRIVVLFFSLFLVGLICVALIPWILSSQWGTSWLLQQISNQTEMEIKSASLKLSWWEPQYIENLEIKTEELSFSCPEVTLKAPLLTILLSRSLEQITLERPHLTLLKPFQPTASLPKQTMHAAGIIPHLEASFSVPTTLKELEILIHEGEVSFADSLSFEQIELHASIVPHEILHCQLSATTLQGDQQGTLSLSVDAAKSEIQQLQASIKHLPTRGVDQLISVAYPQYSGLFYHLLGATLDLECSLIQGTLQLNVVSPQLATTLSLKELDGFLVLTTPADIRYQMTPTLWKQLSKHHPLPPMEETLIQASLSEWRSPFPQFDWGKTSFQGTCRLSALGGLALQINATSSSLDRDLSWNASFQNQAESLSCKGNLTTPLTPQRTGEISLATRAFPLSLLHTLGYDLEKLLGEKADCSASLLLGGAQPHLHLMWNSPLLSLPSLDMTLSDPWMLTSPTLFTYKGLNGEITRLELSPEMPQNLQFEASVHASTLPLFGKTLSHVKGTLQAQTLSHISLQVDSDELHARTEGNIDLSTHSFSLIQPLTAEATLDLPFLVGPAPVQLVINPFAASLHDPLQGAITGQLFCKEAELATAETPISVQNTLLPFQWDPTAQRLLVQFSSQLPPTGSIKGQGTLIGKHLRASLQCKDLATELLDLLSRKPYISALLGASISGECDLDHTPGMQTLSLQLTSPLLACKASLVKDQSGVRIRSITPARWQITPESYPLLDRLLTQERQPHFALIEPTTFTLSSLDLYIPHPLELNALEIIAGITNPGLNFLDKSSKEVISLSAFNGSIYKKGGQTPLTLSLDGTATAAKSGSFLCSVKTDLIGDLSQLTLDIDLQAKQFPCKILDLCARAAGTVHPPFGALLGPTFQLSLKTHLQAFNGPLSLSLSSPTSQAELSGHLEAGTLILDQPLYAQLLITQEASRGILREVNPLDLSAFYTTSPVILQIPKAGSLLPLYPWAPEKLNIPEATLELGKITCRNEGNVNITLGLLKSKQFNKDQDLTLWFAPIDLSIRKGMVDVERTEILIADTFDICAWGKVDLVKEYVDMTLGLTAPTLAQAFGIKGLPENYVLTLPMKGKMDNVQINTGKATAKVALLLAWQNKDLAGQFGGTAGAFAGELLGAIATLPDANAKIPPPKHPFPWEMGRSKEPLPRSKKRFKTSDKPLKQLFKVIR